ncbi:MAG: CorA family divalent cation transporter [Minicystis sp.]
MIDVVLRDEASGEPLWIDIAEPSREELGSIAQRYGLASTAIEDCLSPGHLPKHEKIGDATFMIIRAFDEEADASADTVPWMTRKVALFLGNRFLITVHRRSAPFLGPILEHYRHPKGPVYLQNVLLKVLAAAVETFGAPLDKIEDELHGFEQAMLSGKTAWDRWEDVFRTKSRLMIMKRLLWHSMSTVQKFIPFSSANMPLCQDLRESIESLHFFATGLLDDLNSLLSIQMALASNRTADIMKVLAIFSVFFLPITFIVGVYGMNFRMPELGFRYGYAAIWATMIATVLGIYLWIRKKGWIQS